MTRRSRALPSIAALRAFEAAAHHLSFTGAAQDLEQTQGAVSHQIRELETRLGTTLFKREARGINLTAAGQSYLPFVRESLERLRAGERALTPSDSQNVLTVSCSPNFAQKWLVPRLGGFVQDNPQLDLRISASPQHITFDGDGIDVAVRHGEGNWPGLAVTKLCDESLFPVVSPHLLSSNTAIHSISDFKHYALLHDQQRLGWSDWLEFFNENPTEFDLKSGAVFSQTSLAIDAAVASQGITLARSALVELDLHAGRLIRPVDAHMKADFAYWIVCPTVSVSLPKVRSFHNWLLSQTQSIKENRHNS